MCWESFAVLKFDLGPLVQGQTAVAKLKSAHIRLLLVLEVWDVKTTYRKTCAGNLLMWPDLTLDPSFKVKRRCPNLKVPISRLLLVLLLVKRGWPSLKMPISSLLLLPEVWDVKLTLNSTFLLPDGRSYHSSGLVGFWKVLGNSCCHGNASYPTALKGCRGIVFTHGVRMGGRPGGLAGGWAGGGK